MKQGTGRAPIAEIYTGPRCAYCVRTKTLLNIKGIAYVEKDISVAENKIEMMRRLPQARSIPQIFLLGEHVGGCDDLEQMAQDGSLDARLRNGGH